MRERSLKSHGHGGTTLPFSSSRRILQLSAIKTRSARAFLITGAVAALVLGGTLAATADGSTGQHGAAGTGKTTAGRANDRSATRTTTSTKGTVPTPYLFVHDPTMAEENGTYYLFSTGDPAGVIGNGNIQIRTSRDLRDWTYAGTVFADQPAWITSTLGSIPNLWAPDISYFGGLWHLYYAGSSFGSNNSVIGLATTPTLDPSSPRYHWTDDGLVFQSTTSDDFNAIDPSLVTDASGGKWLVLGSFWSGIKLIALDAATGKPTSASTTVYSIAEKPSPDPEEGAGITYHDGYYYLFVAVGYCCRGISSTYHIEVGRSTSVTGPYADASGTAMTDGGGMELQGTDAGMIGPGSPFIFQAGDGTDDLVYHYYDAYSDGDAWVQIRPLIWVDGWPVTGQALVPIPGAPGPAGGL
jgi:arabinan endo-1,5-alpha-L-arabinosidase